MDVLKIYFDDDTHMFVTSYDDVEEMEEAIKLKSDWVYLYDQRCYINLHKVTCIDKLSEELFKNLKETE